MIFSLITLFFTHSAFAFDFSKITKGLEEVYIDTKKNIEKSAPKVLDDIEEFSRDLTNNVEKGLPKAVEAIGEFSQDVTNNVKKVTPIAIEAIEEFSRDVKNNVEKGVPKAVEAIGEFSRDVANNVKKHGPQALKETKRVYLEVRNEIFEDIYEMLKDLNKAFSCPKETSIYVTEKPIFPLLTPVVSQFHPPKEDGENFDHESIQEKTETLYKEAQNTLNTLTIVINNHQEKIDSLSETEFFKRAKEGLSQDEMKDSAYKEFGKLNLKLKALGTIRLFNSQIKLIRQELELTLSDFKNKDYDEELSLSFKSKVNEMHARMANERQLFEENFQKLLQGFYKRLSESYSMEVDEVAVYFTSTNA